jgi:hypothetical protein
LSCQDAFIVKLGPDGSALTYSTYLGGSYFDESAGIAVDVNGNAYVVGTTDSLDFPTTEGAFRQTCPPNTLGRCEDVFVAKLNPTGTALVYSTYLGGKNSDVGTDIAVDGLGSVYVTGSTTSSDFPTTPRTCQSICLTDNSFGNCHDAFVVKLNPAGSALVYSTYLGGQNGDEGYGIAVDEAGSAYVIGITESTEFPTTPGLLYLPWGQGP